MDIDNSMVIEAGRVLKGDYTVIEKIQLNSLKNKGEERKVIWKLQLFQESCLAQMEIWGWTCEVFVNLT